MDTVSIVVHTLALTVVDSGYVKMRLLNAVTGSITLSLIDMQFLGSFSLKNNILTCIRSRNAEGLSDYYIWSDFSLFFKIFSGGRRIQVASKSGQQWAANLFFLFCYVHTKHNKKYVCMHVCMYVCIREQVALAERVLENASDCTLKIISILCW